MTIIIRRCDEDSTDDVRDIEAACLRGREHEADPVDLTDDVEVWLAFDPPMDEPVAFGVLVDRGHDITPDRSGWHLRMAGTLPEYQRRRLQRRLIRARVAYAFAHGAECVRTYTRPDNAECMRALIACGFRPYRPEDPYRGESFVYWRHEGAQVQGPKLARGRS